MESRSGEARLVAPVSVSNGMARIDEYAALVAARKACRLCAPALTNPAAVESGRYDSDEVGPWSRWQGHLSARLMVVGQDWGDTRYFTRYAGREALLNPTNVALPKLLDVLGIVVGGPGEATGQDVVFFTNAILCLKEGGLQSKVQDAWFRHCAGYLRRQIEIVGPDVVVGLGERAFRSILSAFGLKARSLRREVEDAEGTVLPNRSRAFAVYHCGARIQNMYRNLDAQKADWARLRRFLPLAGECSYPRPAEGQNDSRYQ